MVDVRMHPDDVEAFCAGQLDEGGEAALALQVAQTVPYESQIPNQAGMYLRLVVDHLGGNRELMDWLAQFPGEPALVSATVRLSDLLGALSGSDVVVNAIREMRSTQRDPEELQRYLAPSTTHATLSTLADVVMRRLRAGDPNATIRLDLAVLDYLDRALQVAADQGGDVALAQEYAADARQGLQHAALQTIPTQPTGGRIASPARSGAAASGAAAGASARGSAAAKGLRWTVAATLLAVLIGAYQALAGFAALVDDTFFQTKHDNLLLPLSYTAWGCIHLILGIGLIAAGFGLLNGSHWARKMGLVCIILATLSAIAGILFAPALVVGAIVLIVLDVCLIYILVRHGRGAHY